MFALEQKDSDDADELICIAKTIRESAQIFKHTMNCSLYQKHFSYIKSINTYCKSYPCKTCGRIFEKLSSLGRHIKSDCGSVINNFPGGIYANKATIFELLEGEGLTIDETVPRYFPHWACFDMESFQIPQPTHPTTGQKQEEEAAMMYIARHGVMSASVISNVESYKQPKSFIVSDTLNGHGVVIAMLRHMLEISDKSYRY